MRSHLEAFMCSREACNYFPKPGILKQISQFFLFQWKSLRISTNICIKGVHVSLEIVRNWVSWCKVSNLRPIVRCSPEKYVWKSQGRIQDFRNGGSDLLRGGGFDLINLPNFSKNPHENEIIWTKREVRLNPPPRTPSGSATENGH